MSTASARWNQQVFVQVPAKRRQVRVRHPRPVHRPAEVAIQAPDGRPTEGNWAKRIAWPPGLRQHVPGRWPMALEVGQP